MAMDGIGGVSFALLAILGIWSLVGLGLFIWYLAALARLFPKLGLPGWAGWVPVWNEWQLFQRAGLPGWTAIAGVIPGLHILALVMRIIAIHRINTETGQRVGLTVLGAFIPPLWATLLGSELEALPVPYASGPADPSAPGAGRRTGNAGPSAAQQAAYAPPRGYAPSAPAALAAPPAQSTPGPQRSGSQPSQASQQLAADQAAAAAQQPAEWRGLPPVSPHYAQPYPPQAPQPAQPQQSPVQPHSQQPPVQQPQPDQAWMQRGGPLVQQGAAHPQGGPPQQDSEWGLGLTTEREFERLASEDLLRPPAASLAPQAAPQHFAWPGEQGQRVVAPPIHPAAVGPRPPQEASVPETSSADAAPSAQYRAEVAPAAEPGSAAETRGAHAAPFSTTPAQASAPAAAEEAPASAGDMPSLTSSTAPPRTTAAASARDRGPAGDPAGASSDVDGADDDEAWDRTIVVPRKPRVDWLLELPDGERLEIRGTDVILGRKPQAVGEATTLLIPDKTRTLSKSHARMRLVDGDWTIEDLGSTNGLTLIQQDGTSEEAAPGRQLEVTERMIIGTLEVRLLREES